MLSAFSLDEYNLSKLTTCNYPITTALPRSHPAVSLAHSGHAPAYIFQEHKHSLLDRMPSSSHSQMVGVQNKILQQLYRFMDEVEAVVRKEVERQLSIKIAQVKPWKLQRSCDGHYELQPASGASSKERKGAAKTHRQQRERDGEMEEEKLEYSRRIEQANAESDDESDSDYVYETSSDEDLPVIPDEDSDEYPSSDELKEALETYDAISRSL